MSSPRRARFLAACLALGACGPRKHASLPAVIAAEPPTHTVIVRSDGNLDTSDGRVRYDDKTRDVALELPKGWVGMTSFIADESGPPPLGDLRLRVRLGPEPACVIDLAAEPAPAGGEALRAAIPRGRDLFFFAQTDSPLPAGLPVVSMWTSTAVPGVPGVLDVGYWLVTSDHLLRLEGRFPSDRVAECKEALDGMVTSLTPNGARAAAAPRAARAVSP